MEMVYFGVFDFIVFLINFILKFDECLYFIYFGDKVDVSIYKERNVVNYVWEMFCWNFVF